MHENKKEKLLGYKWKTSLTEREDRSVVKPKPLKSLKFSGLNLELIQNLIVKLEFAQTAWITVLRTVQGFAGLEGICMLSAKGWGMYLVHSCEIGY